MLTRERQPGIYTDVLQILEKEKDILRIEEDTLRWQYDGGQFHPPANLEETTTVHTQRGRKGGSDILSFSRRLRNFINPALFDATFLLHDLGERGVTDILASTKDEMSDSEKRELKRKEWESFSQTVHELGLPRLALSLYRDYERWEDETNSTTEAVFTQFVDKFSNWRTYAIHEFRLSPETQTDEEVEEFLSKSPQAGKVFHRLSALYDRHGDKESVFVLIIKVLDWMADDFGKNFVAARQALVTNLSGYLPNYPKILETRIATILTQADPFRDLWLER